MKQENEISKNAQLGDSGPKLDLGFKEGQTITLNIGVKKKVSQTSNLFLFVFERERIRTHLMILFCWDLAR